MNKNILIIDDEKNILKSLDMILSAEGFTVSKAGNLKDAKTQITDNTNFFLVDVMLPDGDGIEFIKDIRLKNPSAIIIMISGHASIKMAIEATRNGADDFLEKPLSKEKLLITLNNFVKRLALEEKYANLEKTKMGFEFIGKSPAMMEIIKTVDKIAPTNSKVLISGESGTGKEIIASLIHFKSERKNKPYIKINCAAIPEELIEAELFGAEKGAYTGATEQRDGKFQQANGGSLFLDEIGDMSLKTQTKVLRVLQEGEFERVGGNEVIKTDVRVFAATNKDLQQMVKEGSFREDLYFRLHVVPIHLPPLRERGDDIVFLAEYFLQMFSHENNKKSLSMSEAVIKKLKTSNWPGNIRELKNLIERLVIMTDSPVIELKDLPAEFSTPQFDVTSAFEKNQSLRDVRDKTELEYIKFCLDNVNGNIAKAAELLQVDRTYLYKKLKKLGIET
ncbi:MAG: sigma-54-dependent Fis family transcriptional regulator [Calditrichaeota bacterium]|nr:MAG: sigma-54-dependent Fis family transcriptional regulator [Calditrichota bacterium]MBL1206115.1 sigma-54-dependent Fis family transcriptional regulator [Calditrichota bacterium]NOG45940.1 sigma-54-dependent Fis family transcriptional regulator [Calditrichota bacterium]